MNNLEEARKAVLDDIERRKNSMKISYIITVVVLFVIALMTFCAGNMIFAFLGFVFILMGICMIFMAISQVNDMEKEAQNVRMMNTDQLKMYVLKNRMKIAKGAISAIFKLLG